MGKLFQWSKFHCYALVESACTIVEDKQNEQPELIYVQF